MDGTVCVSGYCLFAAVMAGSNYKTVKVKLLRSAAIKVFIYPDRDFRFWFGAVPGEVGNTGSAAAIDACNKAGGGRVVVPAGIWLTGPFSQK